MQIVKITMTQLQTLLIETASFNKTVFTNVICLCSLCRDIIYCGLCPLHMQKSQQAVTRLQVGIVYVKFAHQQMHFY